MRKRLPLLLATAAALGVLCAQEQADIRIIISQGERPTVAVPDLRGTGEAQAVMNAFNATLFSDLQDSGYFKMAAKSMFPLTVPQRPEDFKPPAGTPPRPQGPWLTDWSNPPVSANYLVTGYTAVQNGRLVLFGWLYNVTQPDLTNAQVFGKLYFGTLDEAGAVKVAHEFAADVLDKFGAKSLAGTKIYFTRQHSRGPEPVSEIWVMDHDGANQRQITKLGSITKFVDVSPDGSKIAFMTYAGGSPNIRVMATETGRFLPFYNQRASMNSSPHFTPDGRKILFSSTAGGSFAQIYESDVDGRNLRAVAVAPAVEVEPKVNPKTGTEIVFTSGRSGPPQIYKMNLDGANAVRLTTGEGDAVNPSWHPDGQHIAFSWTRGYDPGNYNIFIMDIATRKYMQLTHGAGKNENPTWAPDGRHLVFSSSRSGSTQIWTMLADGTGLRQLTTQGTNVNPVWSK